MATEHIEIIISQVRKGGLPEIKQHLLIDVGMMKASGCPREYIATEFLHAWDEMSDVIAK